jgi:hypothetical protein
MAARFLRQENRRCPYYLLGAVPIIPVPIIPERDIAIYQPNYALNLQ